MNPITILVLGDNATGKTCYINKCTKNTYNDDYKPTNELELSNSTFEKDGISYNIQISEKPESKPFEDFSKYYDGFIFFSDIKTREDTLKIKEKIEENIPIFYIESKCDLLEEAEYEKRKEEIKNFTEKNEFNGGFLVSSMNGKNINESFKFIVFEIIKRVKEKIKNLEAVKEIKIINEKDMIKIYTYKNEGDKKNNLYECKIDIKQLKEEYDFLEPLIDAYDFVEIVENLKVQNRVKINLYFKKIVIQIGILIYSIYGDKEEVTFDLIHEDLNPEELSKKLIEKLV